MTLYDVSTEKVLFQGTISREAQAFVATYGKPDIAALDKLIEILATLRNGWAEQESETSRAALAAADGGEKMKSRITKADRERFPYHTDDSIRGIKLIEALPDGRLQEALASRKQFDTLQRQLGEGTNPNWTKARIADALYNRGLINEREYDRLSE